MQYKEIQFSPLPKVGLASAPVLIASGNLSCAAPFCGPVSLEGVGTGPRVGSVYALPNRLGVALFGIAVA
jgi:hypothetical protein